MGTERAGGVFCAPSKAGTPSGALPQAAARTSSNVLPSSSLFRFTFRGQRQVTSPASHASPLSRHSTRCPSATVHSVAQAAACLLQHVV